MSVLRLHGILERLTALRLENEMFETVRIDQPLSADSDRVMQAIPKLFLHKNLPGVRRLNGKDAECAEAFRVEGNLEQPMSDRAAIEKFSRSIMMAPAGSKQLALAYLNRSMVLHRQQRYEAALRDLDRAGSGGLPKESQYKLEEQKARCFYAMGKKEASEASKQAAFKLLAESNVPPSKAEAARLRLLQMLFKRRKPPINVTCKLLPNVVGGSNPKVPCLSRYIDIRFSMQRGRHLVANHDIQPGDILIVEEPFAAMLLGPFYLSHCFHCMKRCLNSVPCTQCSQVVFCSEKCRDEAWSSYHNIECILLPHLACLKDSGEASTMLTLSLRLVLKMLSAHGGLEAVHEKQRELEAERRKGPESKRIFDNCGRYDPNSLRAVYYLPRVYLGGPDCTTYEKLPMFAAHIMYLLKTMSDLMPDGLNGETARFLGGLILRMITIRLNTNFGVGEMDDGEFHQCANAVYAVSSLINHSCEANTFQKSANGGFGVLIACQPIEKGEEITVSYISSFAAKPLETRRMQLASYQFVCRCRACLEAWPQLEPPSLTREDYTIKCSRCGGRFKGPIHRNFVKCTHCSHRVATRNLPNLLCKLSKPDTTKKNWCVDVEPVRELHKVLAFPNDFLYTANELMRACFSLSGNCSTDSW